MTLELVCPAPVLADRPEVARPSAVGIHVEGVAHTYAGQHGRIEALRTIDLDVPAGEFVALLGPSGCGKSTLLRIMCGLLAPSTGRVHLAGSPPHTARKQRAIGWLAQEDGLLPWRSVLDNVDLPHRLARSGDLFAFRPLGADRSATANHVSALGSTRPPRDSNSQGRDSNPGRGGKDQEAARAMLRRVGLDGSARMYPHELSGGMRQRAALARALVGQPAFLLLDEPFAHLDELTRERLGSLLVELREESPDELQGPRTALPTTVLVTHSVSEAV
ncbi:MAG TPA: ATP-binding cassette domain-containing protein, partial [Chloroflexota bacterium]|nr:ATP-binding cassette domain-containing protein [Chloroflexota bacterium]